MAVSTIDPNGLNIGQIGGTRNKIINGGMVIDQRNAGAAVTVNSAARVYTVDRWFGFGEGSDGVFTVQRSTDAPAGFTNSALVTVTTADASIGASQLYLFAQSIEGFNSADLGWGSAAAQTVTLSFWVRSSLTGTFGGVLNNNIGNRTYPFTYTINSANTFERKTITITGDTTGTWETGSSSGINVFFSLGAGSSFLGSAGAWSGSTLYGATGQTQLIGTLNATWYITGVQLEAGDTATPFEHRSYGQELALCQRYFERIVGINGIAAANGSTDCFGGGVPYTTTKRTNPTVQAFNAIGTSGLIDWNTAGVAGEQVASSLGTTVHEARPSTTNTTAARNSFFITRLDVDAEL